jgi:hypothetical protein
MDIHIYEITPDKAIGYANRFHDQFKMDVWVGEIACHVRFFYFMRRNLD